MGVFTELSASSEGTSPGVLDEETKKEKRYGEEWTKRENLLI